MKHYSEDTKAAIIKRMMPPNPVSIAHLSTETGVPVNTLYSWRSHYQAKGHAVPAPSKRPDHGSAVDKPALVFETRTLNSAEPGDYCRKKGRYAEQIQTWEQAALSGYQQQEQLTKQQLEQGKTDRLRIQQLEAELRRKNAALAETAALLVLSKKSQALRGDSAAC